jgi:hypothetical protein
MRATYQRVLRRIPRGRVSIAVLAALAIVVGTASASTLNSRSVGVSGLPPVKAAGLAAEQPPPVSKQASQAPKGPNVHRPARTPPVAPEHAGEIGTPTSLGGVPVPFSIDQFTLTNMWKDLRGTTDYSIYAGSLPANPEQGALMVSRVDTDTGDSVDGSGTFVLPFKSGPITLTAVAGDLVSFRYQGGVGTFDLTSGSFALPAK